MKDLRMNKIPMPVTADERILYGGDQKRLPKKRSRSAGCGLVAAVNLLGSLPEKPRPFEALSVDKPIPISSFNQCCEWLRRRYLTYVPGVGLTGLHLAWGINACLRRFKMPYRARWRFSGAKRETRIAAMLDRGYPVILAIGPNFPFFWQKKGVTLYHKDEKGTYHPTTATQAHYVTVTAMDDDWFCVSSWGRQYWISKKEFSEYASHRSLQCLCNIVELS